jgi:hypothetical protein
MCVCVCVCVKRQINPGPVLHGAFAMSVGFLQFMFNFMLMWSHSVTGWRVRKQQTMRAVIGCPRNCQPRGSVHGCQEKGFEWDHVRIIRA